MIFFFNISDVVINNFEKKRSFWFFSFLNLKDQSVRIKISVLLELQVQIVYKLMLKSMRRIVFLIFRNQRVFCAHFNLVMLKFYSVLVMTVNTIQTRKTVVGFFSSSRN